MSSKGRYANEEADYLTQQGYEQLLEATSTHRERLVVRLGGEVGLRAGEIAAIRPADVVRVRREPDRYLLRVAEKPDEHRETYLPPAVERALARYVNSNGIGETERVIDVTPRRVQMLVREVADRAGERTGDTSFEEVSARDLRQHFARTLLCERDVSPRVVRAIGGWRSLEALDPYLDSPTTDEIVDAFDSGTTRPIVGDTALETALIDASTRAELESDVCSALVGRYRFAWIDTPEIDDGETPGAVSGIEPEAVPPLREGFEGGSTGGETGVAASPIQYGETRYGRLYVGISDPESEREREFRSLLGRRIGHAITAIRRRKLLLADTILELEFTSTDQRSTLIAVSERFHCRFELESIVSASESLVYYLTLSGASAPDVLTFAAEQRGIEDSRLVEGRDSGALVEVAVSRDCPLLLLTDYGATISEATVENGEARIVAECAYDTDLRALVDRLTDVFPDSRLVGKQAAERGASGLDGFEQGATDRLTDRQHAVLRAAYFGGYFDWPRGSTAEEVADAMGVSSPTLHSHLRKGQRGLLELLFEEE